MKDFTTDWFSFRTQHWQELVLPALRKSEAPRYLEIGSYEGRSVCWVAENLREVPKAELHCVDIWGNPKVEARFDANIADEPTIFKHKKPSMHWLAEALGRGERFDVIYVDGDHQAKSALLDAAMAWPLLRKGGVMVFDDYPWRHPEGAPSWKIPPKPGIDAFLHLWGNELKILRTNWQVYVQKVA
jgi:predicted O-methyltransferase YrrM